MASTSLTPSQRSLRARIAAYALHAHGGTSTGAGTAAFLGRFGREVDDAATARGERLTAAEREHRITLARKAHMSRLALASSRARTKKAVPVSETSGTAKEDRRAADELPPAA